MRIESLHERSFHSNADGATPRGAAVEVCGCLCPSVIEEAFNKNIGLVLASSSGSSRQWRLADFQSSSVSSRQRLCNFGGGQLLNRSLHVVLIDEERMIRRESAACACSLRYCLPLLSSSFDLVAEHLGGFLVAAWADWNRGSRGAGQGARTKPRALTSASPLNSLSETFERTVGAAGSSSTPSVASQ